MENNWVDFKTVKAAITMQMVFGHYQINWLKKSGEELRGRCPIHQGEGKDTFRANLTKNVFNCFSCKAHGNVLDFVAAMEKCSVRDAAVKLKEWFGLSDEAQTVEKPTVAVGESTPGTNEPLGFALKSVDRNHACLARRAVSKNWRKVLGSVSIPARVQ